MRVPCAGGALDGKVLDQAIPEPTIHQNTPIAIVAHRPHARRKEGTATTRLVAYTEEYILTLTPEGPVYRCTAAFGGTVAIGAATLHPGEDGGYHAWIDRAGQVHATRAGAGW